MNTIKTTDESGKDTPLESMPDGSTPSSVLDRNGPQPKSGKGNHRSPRQGKRHGPSLTQRIKRLEQNVSDLVEDISETRRITLEVSGDNSETLQHILTALEDLEIVPRDPVDIGREIQRLERDCENMAEEDTTAEVIEIDTKLEDDIEDQENYQRMGPLLKGGLGFLALAGTAYAGYTVGKKKGARDTEAAYADAILDNVED